MTNLEGRRLAADDTAEHTALSLPPRRRARMPSRLSPSALVTSTSTCKPTDAWRGAPQSGDGGVGRRELAVMGAEVALASPGASGYHPPPHYLLRDYRRLERIDGGAMTGTAAVNSRCWAPSSDGGRSRAPLVPPIRHTVSEISTDT
uniref:Uncharacterized protein n=1 Tax=Oryza meridionalis TaxID=40149 RepID=A0A0E0D3Y0_9ORYZ